MSDNVSIIKPNIDKLSFSTDTNNSNLPNIPTEENIIKFNHNISILTITKYDSSKCLNILLDIIQNQTAIKQIMEWIIIEGSDTIDNINKNKEFINIFIQTHQQNLKFIIKYIEIVEPKTNGELRNIANSFSTGSLITWMDETGYYFKNRIESIIDFFNQTSYLICGSIETLVWDINLDKIFKTKNGTTSVLSYTKSYLQTQPEPKFSETNINEFQTFIYNDKPIGIMKKDLSMVQIAYGSKLRTEIVACLLSLLPKKYGNITEWELVDNLKIENIIRNQILELYKIYLKKESNPYDIIYNLGFEEKTKFNPKDKNLSGSEQSVVYLSENWVKSGKKVAVYGNFQKFTLNGVDYYNWVDFPFGQKLKTLILWRFYGTLFLMGMDIQAEKIYWDHQDNVLHDFKTYTEPNHLNQVKRVFNQINYFCLKSSYHKFLFKTYAEKILNIELSDDKIKIIPNGVRLNEFTKIYCDLIKEPVQRNPFRFCYCSSYDRGLVDILEKIWSEIYKIEPRAELHIYYGFDFINEQTKTKLLKLMAQPGVMEHGKQPVEIIAREKMMSTFQLYLSNADNETDCISIKESVAAGCIPIISYYGVFREREGIHYNWDPHNKVVVKNIIDDLIQKMYSDEFVSNVRKIMSQSNLLINWEDTAKLWFI